jgi:GNAT superfamily N-acetyltransferase
MNDFLIRSFTLADQRQARALILAGLVEHWGALDLSLNLDLDDIAASYAGGDFLVAVNDGELVGTGALIQEGDGMGRIVRMSVARSHRRCGVGSRILNALLDRARARGYHRIVLETTETWDDAIGFYTRHGFRITHYANGDAHFEMMLNRDNAR